MAQTKRGAMKALAVRLGSTIEELDERVARGEKWCVRCKTWQARERFGRDATRYDGLAAACRDSRGSFARAAYVAKPPLVLGRKYNKARDGDKKQARGRINHLVHVGVMPDPNDLPCLDCGQDFSPGKPRHEYDHHKGYAAEHHETVQVVCVKCHRNREATRGVYLEVARTRRPRAESGRAV
jgi:hypothetical protein